MMMLSKIFLHNWHRFAHHVIKVDESLYLAGHNGSGKSSILDALQLVLVADLQKVRFNSSAQDRSARTLDSYVRGKIGEGRYLREGNTVCYVAAEFRSKSHGTAVTLGVCIEASPQSSPERTYFITHDFLDDDFLCPDMRPRTRRDLKTQLKLRKGTAVFDGVAEYQEALLKALGGMNSRFFDLFMRAVTFQPIRNIREFVEQWLLEKQPLDLEILQNVTRRLNDLRSQCLVVKEQMKCLQDVLDIQKEVHRLRVFHRDFNLLTVVARAVEHAEQVQDLELRLKTNRANLQDTQNNLRNISEEVEELRAKVVDLDVTIQQSDTGRRQAVLQSEISKLQRAQHLWKTDWASFCALSAQCLANEAIQANQNLGKDLDMPLEQGIESTLDKDFSLLLSAAIKAFKEPESHSFTQIMARSELVWEHASQRVSDFQQSKAVLDYRLAELRKTAAELERKILSLEKEKRPQLPAHIDKAKSQLQKKLQGDVFVMCELLEINDADWRDAVEATLGARRFALVVNSNEFENAVRILDQLRKSEGVYDVSVIDLEKINERRRQPQPNSLALKVSCSDARVRCYVDFVLGEIICVDHVAQLRQHQRSVTREVMMHSEYAIRAIPPYRFRPWHIGQRAAESQLQALKEELNDYSISYAQLAEEIQRCSTKLKSAQNIADLRKNWEKISPREFSSLDEQKLADAQRDLAELDVSSLQSMIDSLKSLKAKLSEYTVRERKLVEDLASLKVSCANLEKELPEREMRAIQSEQLLVEAEQKHPDLCKSAKDTVSEKRKNSSLSEIIRNAESTARSYETRAANELQKLIQKGSEYNTKFQFAANPGNPDDTKYAAELTRLQTTSLPDFQNSIEEESRKAEHELREHILHKLREQIGSARAQLEKLNDALKKLQFRGESYRFRWYASDDLHEFYQLITEARNLGSQSLIDSDFYKKYRAQFERFYESLTSSPQSEIDRRMQERLTDYRSYLSYDIEVTHADGQISRLSRILGQTSGGETQTPFYVTIAGSFLQLYSTRERLGYECPRIVVFDEAFSKMDQERIGATLQLFHFFGLQVITATPLERCEYLVPHMKTSLVLTGIGDDVHIEPYKNYTATLAQGFQNLLETVRYQSSNETDLEHT